MCAYIVPEYDTFSGKTDNKVQQITDSIVTSKKYFDK